MRCVDCTPPGECQACVSGLIGEVLWRRAVKWVIRSSCLECSTHLSPCFQGESRHCKCTSTNVRLLMPLCCTRGDRCQDYIGIRGRGCYLSLLLVRRRARGKDLYRGILSETIRRLRAQGRMWLRDTVLSRLCVNGVA